jgi:predicted DNA binding CopG/RHH family protein
MKQIFKPIYKLDKEEQELVDSVNRGEWKTVPNFKEEKLKLERAAKLTTQILKSKNINLRLQPMTIVKLKQTAEKLGLPYQTLASSILHRYVNGQTIHLDTC